MGGYQLVYYVHSVTNAFSIALLNAPSRTCIQCSFITCTQWLHAFTNVRTSKTRTRTHTHCREGLEAAAAALAAVVKNADTGVHGTDFGAAAAALQSICQVPWDADCRPGVMAGVVGLQV
eukprot:scaffold140222_cov27-Tisochrysis_lutea.AAC.1